MSFDRSHGDDGQEPGIPLLLVSAYCFAPNRQSLAAGKSPIEGALESRGGLCAFNHDQIIGLALEAGCGKVRGASALQSPASSS
jgi:hypothetical protein